MGGTNAPENLVLLHPIDHAIAHLVRYKMYGDIRDKWASNWLQKIVDPEVYSVFSKQRELKIKERRAIDPEFDFHMKSVRSNATKNRKEGYQKEAGKKFKEKFSSDHDYAKSISEKKVKAQKASSNIIREKSAIKAKKVLDLRMQGKKYDEIVIEVGCSIGFVSKVINNAKIS
jgi:hypothetical protein